MLPARDPRRAVVDPWEVGEDWPQATGVVPQLNRAEGLLLPPMGGGAEAAAFAEAVRRLGILYELKKAGALTYAEYTVLKARLFGF